jgi:hypothetical protein
MSKVFRELARQTSRPCYPARYYRREVDRCSIFRSNDILRGHPLGRSALAPV